MSQTEKGPVLSWTQCRICPEKNRFKTPGKFSQHLREYHCTKEGGSFVCRYGNNDVCASLPLEGVSDQDYESHVLKHHVLQQNDDQENSSTADHTNSDISLYKSSSSSSLVSVNSVHTPNLLVDPHRWTVYNSTQNLPAVLNDPRRSKRESDFFTKSWGDNFTDLAPVQPSVYIPNITWAHFEHYLAKTSRRYRKHLRRSSSYVAKSNENLPFPLKTYSDKNLPDISVVPKIFMQPDFNLENPETFHSVIPWSAVQPPPKAKDASFQPAKQTSRLLQEKLSHYLDIVEVQIARQISLQSDAFFHAMTSHDALSEKLVVTLKSVSALREKVHTIDNILVNSPLKILQLRRLRNNYLEVHNKLKLMATVHQAQPTIQVLLSTSEFVGALDLIEATQEILTQELAGVQSFRHLGSQLAEMEKMIKKMMQAEFLKHIAADLNRPLTTDAQVTEEDRLSSIMFGMLRLKQFSFINTYSEEACTAVKATVKQTVIECFSKDDNLDLDSTTGGLADQCKVLDFQKWLSLLNEVFENIVLLLQRVHAVYKLMCHTVSLAAGKVTETYEYAMQNITEVMITEECHDSLHKQLEDMLGSICNNAHERCAKLLVARSKDGAMEKLLPLEFVSLCKSIDSFSSRCEEISKKPKTALRLALQSQANKYVTRFHDDHKTKLSFILEREQWKQADVPSEFQDMVDHVIKTGSFNLPKKTWTNEKPKSFLLVNAERYVIVGSALLMLQMIVEYCQHVEDIPLVAPDLLTRLLDLLKNFNSRTCQLILGAGALQLVGLKTITTNNLALAARCLQLIFYFLPKVKEHFDKHLPSRHQYMSKHFHQIQKDYQEHVQEIHSKLIFIISNMLESELTNWEVKAPVPSPCFRAIAKQLKKFHAAISDVLSEKDLQELLHRMNLVFKEKLRHHLARLKVNNDGGPQHGLVTQELTFCRENLKSLGITPSLDDLWQSR